MGGLSHRIERAGIATTQISLIREHTERIKPPRALWVPFELGRPLGVPGDAAFQRDVLRAALALLDDATAPTLVDYPHEAPAAAGEAAWACPVALPAPLPNSPAEALAASLLDEARRLRPWYDQARAERGRTAVGVSGRDALEPMTALLAGYASGNGQSANGRSGNGNSSAPDGFAHPMPLLLRFVADDLKALYFEAVMAQPGRDAPSTRELNAWLFGETVLGDTLYRVRDRLAASDDNAVKWMGNVIVPGEFAARPSA